MRVILKIGSSEYLSPDAATAAKVADLLGQMQKVDLNYCSATCETVLLLTSRYPRTHVVEIQSFDESMRQFKDVKEQEAFEAFEKAKQAATPVAPPSNEEAPL